MLDVRVCPVPLRRRYASLPWGVFIGSEVLDYFVDKKTALRAAEAAVDNIVRKTIAGKTWQDVRLVAIDHCRWCGTEHHGTNNHTEGELFFCGAHNASLCKDLYYKRLRLYVQVREEAAHARAMQETGTD